MKSRSRHRVRQHPLSWKAKLVGGAVGLLLVWQTSVISLAAGHGDFGDDIKAADFASVSPAAATAAAGQRLTDGDPAGAKVFATHALSAAPISADSLRDLGLAEQGLGNWQGAGAIFSQGAALGWHDIPTQLWLAQAFLQQKNYGAAAQRTDAALRVTPMSDELYRTLDQLITEPHFAKAIAERLALNPGWRLFYFRYIDGISESALAARVQLLTDLSATTHPPSREEIIPLLYPLIHVDRTALARSLWERSQHVSGNNIFDPNFAQAKFGNGSPFEWSMFSVPGATISIIPRGPGNLIGATTDGAASGVLLRQVTALLPGAHNLTYTGTISASVRDAFGWSIRCIKNGKILMNSMGGAPAQKRSFIVPNDCGGQQIELLVSSTAAAAGSEIHIERIYID